jgi:MYXO-CTERM domain-containing protein
LEFTMKHIIACSTATLTIACAAHAGIWNFSFTGTLTPGGVGTGSGVFAGVDGPTASGTFSYLAEINDASPYLYDDGSGYQEYQYTVASAAITFNGVTTVIGSSALRYFTSANDGSVWFGLGVGTQGDVGSVDVSGIPFGPALQAFSGGTGTGQMAWPPNSGINYNVSAAQLVSVPAPGALALLGIAGLAGGRRRRA